MQTVVMVGGGGPRTAVVTPGGGQFCCPLHAPRSRAPLPLRPCQQFVLRHSHSPAHYYLPARPRPVTAQARSAFFASMVPATPPVLRRAASSCKVTRPARAARRARSFSDRSAAQLPGRPASWLADELDRLGIGHCWKGETSEQISPEQLQCSPESCQAVVLGMLTLL